MHCEPIVHLKLTLKCPQVLCSQEGGGGERGNLYCTEALAISYADAAGSRIERQSHKRQSRESHRPNSMKTSVWLCLEGAGYVLVCLYKLEARIEKDIRSRVVQVPCVFTDSASIGSLIFKFARERLVDISKLKILI